MYKKIINILFLLFIFSFTNIIASNTNSVILAWDPVLDSSVVGYNIYYGIGSRTYTNVTFVGSNTISTVNSLVSGITYYFAVTATNNIGLESDYSDEVSYLVPNTITNIPNTYLGVKLEWWTNMIYINNQNFNLTSFVNNPTPQFYRSSLIITNRGNIVDLKSKFEWWTNLYNVNQQVFYLKSFTNASIPQFYRSSLIITNQTF